METIIKPPARLFVQSRRALCASPVAELEAIEAICVPHGSGSRRRNRREQKRRPHRPPVMQLGVLAQWLIVFVCFATTDASAESTDSTLPLGDTPPGPSWGSDADKACMECHSVSDLITKDRFTGREYRLSIDAAAYPTSAHGKLACAACHERGYDRIPHTNARRRDPFACLYCHRNDDALKAFNPQQRRAAVEESVHTKEVGRIFDCHACHDVHAFSVLSTVTDRARGASSNDICLRCHSASRPLAPFDEVKRADEVHGYFPRAALHLNSTTCVTCHTAPNSMRHTVLPVEESVRRCEDCHSKSAPELTALYGDRTRAGESVDGGPQTVRRAQAVSNADTLSDVYVIGANRSSGLDRLSLLVVLLFFVALFVHALARAWTSRKPS